MTLIRAFLRNLRTGRMMLREKAQNGNTTRPKVPMHRPGADCFVRAMKPGNARGAKGAGHPRQDGVNGQPDELLVLMEGGSLLFWGGTSRMNREVHVRICGRLGVRLPGPTRRFRAYSPEHSRYRRYLLEMDLGKIRNIDLTLSTDEVNILEFRMLPLVEFRLSGRGSSKTEYVFR